jgi:hypothetical protein
MTQFNEKCIMIDKTNETRWKVVFLVANKVKNLEDWNSSVSIIWRRIHLPQNPIGNLYRRLKLDTSMGSRKVREIGKCGNFKKKYNKNGIPNSENISDTLIGKVRRANTSQPSGNQVDVLPPVPSTPADAA